MNIKEFNDTLEQWSKSLAKQIRFCKSLGKRVYVIALSRKMPRFFDWLQKAVEDQTIKLPNVVDLCKLLRSDGVEITTEYAIPLIFGGYSKSHKDQLAGIIADDVIIWGATLQRISMQWWAFSGEVPYVIALFRGMNSVIVSILESNSTITMPSLGNEELEEALDIISRKIHSTSLPIDIEYPLIYSNASYEIVKEYIIKNCPPEWISYEVKSESYKDLSESTSVLLLNCKTDGYTNDHAKIRLFKKATGCCIEMIAPSYVNVLKLKDRKLFDGGDDANNNLYTKAWQSVFDVLHIGKDDGNNLFTTIVQNDQMNQAIFSLLIIWAEYLYCLSVFTKNCHFFFPKETFFNIHEDDLAIILGKNIANIVFDEITSIITKKIIYKPAFEPITLQEYVNPEELRDIYLRRLATELKDEASVDENLDTLYKISHFSSDIYRSMSKKKLTGHHCIGESFESLIQRIGYKHPEDNELFKKINHWVDIKIDECKLAPKYEIVIGSDNQRYFRRFFLCGSNKI